jgi:hypothetical protein
MSLVPSVVGPFTYLGFREVHHVFEFLGGQGHASSPRCRVAALSGEGLL